MLQTRNGKRTATAALKIASDMVDEGLITKDEALQRIEPGQLDQLLHPAIDPSNTAQALTKGLPASPGAAVGEVVFDADTAAARGEKGEKVVLVRYETTPDDIHGVLVAQGILTAHGGMTSHAAVVARGFAVSVWPAPRSSSTWTPGPSPSVTIFQRGRHHHPQRDHRRVFGEALKLIPPRINEDFQRVVAWADDVRTMRARQCGQFRRRQQGSRVGCRSNGCRTEHMFMAADRLPAVRKMILAEDSEARASALEEILPMQQKDFEGIFTAMKGLPVTVRLLDPPLHEFLPNHLDQALKVQRLELTGGDQAELAKERALLAQVKKLHELNPMLGTRGCRLAMMYPEIPEMQARAIIRAALAVLEREGETAGIEIMIPLVSLESEIKRQREIVDVAVQDEFAKAGKEIPYTVGTMIELPRAALIADKIAQHADFFSFGTNDLTQTTLGISRDDAENSF